MIINNVGTSLNNYYEQIYNRSDLSCAITHLTKPSEEYMKRIVYNDYSCIQDLIFDINCGAVDVLIKILKDGEIKGSGIEGFIVNGKNRRAACFQDIPLMNLKENVKLSLDYFITTKRKKLRYCGVGISFDKFYIYKKG